MGWFWADNMKPSKPVTPHPSPSSDIAPPVSSIPRNSSRKELLTIQAWMPHAQSYLDFSISSPELATAASRRLLMPYRISQCTPVVFRAPILNPLQVKPSELYAVKYLSIPFHQPENRPTNLPHHIIHSPRRRRNELGISFPATNVQRDATERL